MKVMHFKMKFSNKKMKIFHVFLKRRLFIICFILPKFKFRIQNSESNRSKNRKYLIRLDLIYLHLSLFPLEDFHAKTLRNAVKIRRSKQKHVWVEFFKKAYWPQSHDINNGNCKGNRIINCLWTKWAEHWWRFMMIRKEKKK